MHKILIVDDDSRICQLFSITLKKANYDVVVANNVEQGLRTAILERPDLIISDFMMPDMNGEQFCTQVRNTKEIASTPFIVITGRGSQDLRIDGLSKLFDDYLEKPVDMSFLVAKVNAILRRRKEDSEKNKKRTKNFSLIILSMAITILLAGSSVLDFKIRLKSKDKELTELHTLKGKYDKRILQIQHQLDSLGWELDDLDFERLNRELNSLVKKAKKIALELPEKEERNLVINGIKQIMSKFGEDNYIVPPLFASEVSRMIEFYTGPHRKHTERYLSRGHKYLPMIKQIFEDKGLPEELGYIPMVESGFNPEAVNPNSGATGMWQFMVETGREYGLRTNKYVDERMDPLKSSIAASEYLLDLISIFGEESVLLALASYNIGDGIIRYQLKKVHNPSEERDFWYLFRKRALPQETREYIPKIFAVIIISRNVKAFGFDISKLESETTTQE